MTLAVFVLSNYYYSSDREDELFLIPMFQDISKFYINMFFEPILRRKRVTRKVVKEIWKNNKRNIQDYTIRMDGEGVKMKDILNHCNGDLETLRESLMMIMSRTNKEESSTGFSISSGYMVKI